MPRIWFVMQHPVILHKKNEWLIGMPRWWARCFASGSWRCITPGTFILSPVSQTAVSWPLGRSPLTGFCSIGGGGFALIRTPDGTYASLDFREMAPMASDPFMFEADPLSQVWGGLAAGIPGELRGLEHIHSSYGTLPWRQVVQPATEIARDGWIVDSDLLYYMDTTIERRNDFFVADPTWAEDFAPNGKRVQLGDRITRRKYAETLEVIGREGAGAFYEGAIANATVRANRAWGGLFTVEDMRDYRMELREPIQAEYHGHLVTSCPAPAGGAVVLSILKTMEGYDIGMTEDVNRTTHRLNEAFRFAFGARAVMGDPRFLSNMAEYEEEITSEAFAETVRSRINDGHTLPREEYEPGSWAMPDTVNPCPPPFCRCKS